MAKREIKFYKNLDEPVMKQRWYWTNVTVEERLRHHYPMKAWQELVHGPDPRAAKRHVIFRDRKDWIDGA